jgi:hypothetical protein
MTAQRDFRLGNSLYRLETYQRGVDADELRGGHVVEDDEDCFHTYLGSELGAEVFHTPNIQENHQWSQYIPQPEFPEFLVNTVAPERHLRKRWGTPRVSRKGKAPPLERGRGRHSSPANPGRVTARAWEQRDNGVHLSKT